MFLAKLFFILCHLFFYLADILWTPFRQVNIPPPMCAHQLTLPSAVLAIAYSPPPCSNDFVALTSKGLVHFVKSEKSTKQLENTNGFRNITTPPIIQSISRRYKFMYTVALIFHI